MGKFKRQELIGKGSFGEAYLVKYKRHLFAMKEPLEEHEISDEEINILKAVHHPFLLYLKYCVTDNVKTCVVTEYCPGGDLLTLINKQKFSEAEAKFCASQIIFALEYLHNVGVIYRDLKPENIVLDSKGHLKIIDYGLAKFLDCELSAYSWCGTPDYMAPELLLVYGYSKAIDYWALGVTLYVMVAGTPPFSGKGEAAVLINVEESPLTFLDDEENLKISKEFRSFLKNLIQRDLGTRFNIEQMKGHPWFEYVNWDNVYNKKSHSWRRFHVKYMERDPWFRNLNWDDLDNKTTVPVPERLIQAVKPD